MFVLCKLTALLLTFPRIFETSQVTGGTAKYKASFDGFPVVNEKDDLCTTLEGGDSPCPLSGHIDSSATDEVPADTPSGTLKGTISWTDQNGEPILCLAYTFKV